MTFKMDDEELRAKVALSMFLGTSEAGLVRLLKTFGSAREILRSGVLSRGLFPDLDWIGGSILGDDRVERALRILTAGSVRVTSILEPDYPASLGLISNPPPILYARGRLPGKDEPLISLVGRRNPSASGRSMAYELGRSLALSGIGVVSGLARGIDSEAHRGTLEGGGYAVAVLGTGIDVPYPVENRGLMESIAEKGCVLSEFSPGTPPTRYNFPRRNRLISGLTLGIVVIEAGMRSGSLTTARSAESQGKRIFVVPGDPTFPGTAGSNTLLRRGAIPVLSASDVVSRIPGTSAPPERRPESKRHDLHGVDKRIFDALHSGPMDINSIVEETALPANVILSALVRLELDDAVERIPGNIFRIRPRFRAARLPLGSNGGQRTK
ncbi:MAG: DNA-processing protein DprA [Candidatus Eisenbacteria bacterium]|nr:DNA-processing protein DprA [Candidatus Eisenbacteria bacterium]